MNQVDFRELSVESIGKFFDVIGFFETKVHAIIETIALIVFLWLLSKALNFLVKRIAFRGKKAQTIGHLVSSTIKYGIFLIGLFLVLSAWGVETPTLLASLGILGLAISFGAQNLIEDILAGLFIIFEDQFEIGDVIQIDAFRGKVTELGLRTTKFEDINRDIKIINNSDIRGAINTSNKLSPAICDISVGYDANLKQVEEIIKTSLGRIKANIPHIKEGPFYFGVESLAESSVILRIYAKCEEEHKYSVRRQLNREMKLIFDENHIEIPFNQLVVHQSIEK